ncbi:short-chain-enoyl-CoA hydratase [Christensenellaceae bacterium]|nr:short-chain-enoyl-CoA hydratase [Christensenellaceae bacterium]BDF62205.1 short-chain-enoyl-CoA hydratase [Christensenellaceae bacterium]
MTDVTVQKQGPVGIMTLSSDKGLNIFSVELFEKMTACVDDLDADPNIRAIIITGEGKAFMAGSDVKYMLQLDVEQGMYFTHVGVKFFRKLELLRKPVIAAVNGYSMGGGTEMSMACDIRIASSKAVFCQPETGLGIIPGFNGTQRMVRLLGPGKAKELIMTAERIDAQEACRIGLVNKVVEPEELLDEAIAMANRIAANSPMAVAAAKQAIGRGAETDLETGIVLEEMLTRQCYDSPDRVEGMTAFVEKRKADFPPLK